MLDIRIATLVNRLVDDDGKPIPQEYTFDGLPIVIKDRLQVPYDAGRIIVHQSMCLLDPVTNRPQYKLGCPEMGLPCEPLKASVLPNELLDRQNMPFGKKVKAVRIHNPILRTEPTHVSDPGRSDGAFPGTYGEKA